MHVVDLLDRHPGRFPGPIHHLDETSKSFTAAHMDALDPPPRFDGILQGIPGQISRFGTEFACLYVRWGVRIGSRAGFRIV